MKRFSLLLLFLVVSVSALAGSLKVGSLNCYLLFDPTIDHPGKVDDENRLSAAQYEAKLTNLSSLVRDLDVVALQETGGRAEIEALAEKAGMAWMYAKGKDTYTGQEVGLLYRSKPGWRFASVGRAADLESYSKHLVVSAQGEGKRMLFLVIHAIRPNSNADKHAKQAAAAAAWAAAQRQASPGTIVIVLGDTNHNDGLYLSAGTDVLSLTNPAFPATHLSGMCLDRIVLFGGDALKMAPSITRPPYPARPNNELKTVWTDHYLLALSLEW